MRAEFFFTDDEKIRIREAVLTAETKTSGEIVPMLVTASARYTEVEILGLGVGLAVGTGAALLWADPWGSVIVHLWPLAGAAIGLFLCRLSGIKRHLLPKSRIDEAVYTRGLAAFTAEGVHYTREHNGILIFVSLLEHEVEIIADQGINDKVAPGTWEGVVAILTAGLKSGHACDAFCNAIEYCGDILAQHFPPSPDDLDELPSQLVTRSQI